MKRLRIVLTAVAVGGAAFASVGAFSGHAAHASSGGWGPLSCGNNVRLCTEVEDDQTAFGWYVGHDEPSVLFYSHQAGSGNHMQYNMTLPVEPKGGFNDKKGYTGEITPALWFGMAMCASESYPEQNNHDTVNGTASNSPAPDCTPDSDTNIIDPAQPGSYKNAPGVAYMELQFYPPGFASQFADDSCDATKWCAALTIDSLAEDPINGTTLNGGCVSQIGGSIEYVNFAYLTMSGSPIGPPNPKDFQFIGSGDPKSSSDTFYMNQGDNLSVSLTDTANGLKTTVVDNTTHQTGFMTASSANHFGQILYDANGTTCTEQDYNFHPMYSTSRPTTRVLWAAHSYNVAFDIETGHFDFCTSVDANTATCQGKEGIPGDQEPVSADINNYPNNPDPNARSTYDDFGCFSMANNTNQSWIPPSNQPQAYCVATNDPGFDGTSYNKYWPDGSKNNATSVMFSSPLTGSGAGYTDAYPQAALETDLPRIETGNPQQNCLRTDASGCTLIPVTDDGTPAKFYPFFSLLNAGHGSCMWGVGDKLPHSISNPSVPASVNQYGPALFLNYWKFVRNTFTDGALSANHYNDFNSGAFDNPC